mgnify:CR=1 FL=1
MRTSAPWHIGQGATRTVLLTNRYAIKIPRLVEWRLFLHGLLANMQERQFWHHWGHEKLCPVLCSIPGGWLLVMPRAAALSREEFAVLNVETFRDAGTGIIPVEDKQDSFGWYKGRIVAVDYGS